MSCQHEELEEMGPCIRGGHDIGYTDSNGFFVYVEVFMCRKCSCLYGQGIGPDGKAFPAKQLTKLERVAEIVTESISAE